MRPIKKRIWFDENQIEIDKQYSPYGTAKDDLIDNIGRYCSFCEVVVHPKSSLEVEHVQPKNLPKYSNLKESWSNFLLACKNCNTTKGNKDVLLTTIHLPHKNNTFLSIKIKEGGMIEINDSISDIEKNKAREILRLVGIDRRPGHPNYSSKDDRWQNRYETWNLAQKYLKKYQSQLIDIDSIADLAINKGFFTVWMTVFEQHGNVRQALINSFNGTADDCFDNRTLPINRNGAEI